MSQRIAKMYVDEMFSGLDYFNFPKITVIDNKMGVEEMVKVSDISVTSTCEHHFVTIDGNAKVAYYSEEQDYRSFQDRPYRPFLRAASTGARTSYPAGSGSPANPA